MLIIILLLLLNGIAPNANFILKYRLDIAGAPISILDGLLFIGVLLMLIPGLRARFPAQLHPLLPRMLILSALATVGGIVAFFFSETADPYYLITTVRNFLTIPAAAVASYCLINQPRDLRRYCFWFVIASTGAAVMIMLFFRSAGEQQTKLWLDINSLRTMEYGVAFAGTAAAFLIYQLSSGNRMMPAALAVVLAGVCFIGQCATLSRSDWVSIVLAIGSVYFLLPRVGRAGKVLKFIGLAPVILLFIFVGVRLADRATGRDFAGRLVERVETLLPGERTTKTVKAWDSRLDSQLVEIRQWARRPILGHGFGHRAIYNDYGQSMGGYGHNTWTFTLFQNGPLGLAATLIAVVGCWVVGRRMVLQANGDVNFTLAGALGAVFGAYFFFLSLTTATFNSPRPALTMGLFFGMVMRARAMQLELARQQAELEAYYEQHPEEQPLPEQQYLVEEPVFGNWYQPN